MKDYFYAHILSRLHCFFELIYDSEYLVGDREEIFRKVLCLFDLHVSQKTLDDFLAYPVSEKDSINVVYFRVVISQLLRNWYKSLDEMLESPFSPAEKAEFRKQAQRFDKEILRSIRPHKNLYKNIYKLYYVDGLLRQVAVTLDCSGDKAVPEEAKTKALQIIQDSKIGAPLRPIKDVPWLEILPFCMDAIDPMKRPRKNWEIFQKIVKILFAPLPALTHNIPIDGGLINEPVIDGVTSGFDELDAWWQNNFTWNRVVADMPKKDEMKKFFYNTLFFPTPYSAFRMRLLMKLRPPHQGGAKVTSYDNFLREFKALYLKGDVTRVQGSTRFEDIEEYELTYVKNLDRAGDITNEFDTLTKACLYQLIGRLDSKHIRDIFTGDTEIERDFCQEVCEVVLDQLIDLEKMKSNPSKGLPYSYTSRYTIKKLNKIASEIGLPKNAFDKLNFSKTESCLFFLDFFRLVQGGSDGIVMVINLIYELIQNKYPISFKNEKGATASQKQLDKRKENCQNQEKLSKLEKKIYLKHGCQEIKACFSRESLFVFNEDYYIDSLSTLKNRLNTIVLVDIRHMEIHLLGHIKDIELLIQENKYGILMGLMDYYLKTNSQDTECQKIYEELQKLTTKEIQTPEGTKIVVEEYQSDMKTTLIKLFHRIFHIDNTHELIEDNRFTLIIYFLYLLTNTVEWVSIDVNQSLS